MRHTTVRSRRHTHRLWAVRQRSLFPVFAIGWSKVGTKTRTGSIAAVAVLVMSALSIVAAPAQAATTLTVCAYGCAYTQVSAAVAAANDGDTVAVGPGTYAGGFTITKSITVTGAGAARTIITGGDSVITVGTLLAALEPTVVLHGVTITGGDSTTSGAGAGNAGGGGVVIPPGANFGQGGAITITDSAVTGNIVSPSSTVDVGIPCPDNACPFAQAAGGGIASWGSVTLERTVVSNNALTGTVSDADGGGIYIGEGPLVVRDSLITRNRASSTSFGRFAEGGGIFLEAGSLTIQHSIVSNNSSSLATTLPAFWGGVQIPVGVNAGGIHVGDNIPTAISDSAITGNTATATDPVGEVPAFDAAVLVGDSPLTMSDTLIAGNQATATLQTTSDIGPQGSVVELDGPGIIDRTSIVGNTTTVTTPTGLAQNAGALAVLNFNNDPALVTMTNSVVNNNVAQAFSTTGTATVAGSGVINNSLLQMNHVLVSGNIAKAVGTSGFAQGGGIWNGVDFSGPPVTLTLDNVNVVGNSASGSSGITLQGGGLFTTLPVTLNHTTTIAGNHPDQCFGCGPAAAATAHLPFRHAMGRH